MKWNKQMFAATLLLANSVLLPIAAIAENNSAMPSSEVIEKEEKQEKNYKNETEREKKEATTESSSEASKEATVSSEIPVTPEITLSSEETSAVENEEKAPEGATNAEVETDAGTTTHQEVRLADWETEDKGSYVLITKYTGSSTEIVVPNEIDGKPTKLKDIDSTVFPNLSLATSFKVLPREDGTKVGVESTDLSNAFKDKTSLKTIDLSGLDTSNVTNMAYMFYNCNTLTTLNVRGWNTSNVTNMGYTFARMRSLPELDVSSFDTSNVTNMEYMFYYCENIAEINVSNFNTKNVTNIECMFANMPKIVVLDVSSFDLSSTNLNSSNFFSIFDISSLPLPHRPVGSVVIATDPKFFSSSIWAQYRAALSRFPILDANGGSFNNSADELRYITGRFVITPEENDLVTFEQFKKENIPTKKGRKFLGWKLVEGDDSNATNVVPDLIGTKYQAQWANTSVKVKYVFEDTGKEIASSKTIEGEVGESYDATTPEYKLNIDGYVLDESRLPDNAKGTFSKEAKEVVYYYKALQTSIVNGSFEDPVIDAGNYEQFFQAIPGWKSLHDRVFRLNQQRPGAVPAIDGKQWVELQTVAFTSDFGIYQDVKTTPGETLYWEVSQRGVYGEDTAAIQIGAPDGELVEQKQVTSPHTEWKTYSGYYTVPEGQTTTRFQLKSIRVVQPWESDHGNFFDKVIFTNIKSTVKVNFVDQSGKSIKEPQIITGYKDQAYDLTDIVETPIPGYKLDESKIPEGIKGTFTEEAKEITLTYKPLDIHIPSEGEDNTKPTTPEELSNYGIAYLPKQFQTESTVLNDAGPQSIPVNKTDRFDVGVRDLRNKENQWTLNAQLVWNVGKELPGSSIKTTNKTGVVMKNINNGTDLFNPDTDLIGSNNEVQGETDVTITNVPTLIMTANNVSHNAVYNYNLGDVSLEIPEARTVQPGSYEGYVEWNLSNVL
ncbi:MucBP domain-containing protein [Enterococcus sp. AZ129]|uniref:MucBP domain-containing protein n=1 Tax=unclassified Enterococcus TaxID=2608891 RepID=UPI003F251F8A